MNTLNMFDTYMMQAVVEEISPVPSFFKDRYFPTGEGDIFASDKVLVEYKDGDQMIAPFVSQRVGDIPVDRMGYEVHELQPAYIGLSRRMSVDELNKRGFGEALYANSTPAQRAARLQLEDFSFLDRRIARREEWMAVQTMLTNACTMQTYIDDKTEGETLEVKFFEDSSEHAYSVSQKWDTTQGDFFGDVELMCEQLSKRGLAATDLLMGTDVAHAILDIEKVAKLLDRNSGIITGTVDPKLTQYPGVVFMGKLNFMGFELNLFSVNETYKDSTGHVQKFFPSKGAMVTAPGCGHMMYGQITQINYGESDFTTISAIRVPKLIVNQDADIRKLRLATRPLAAPKNNCPYIYAANAVN